MGKGSIAFDQFDTDLHRQWKQDRVLRQRVPLNETWRGCIGLAVLLDKPDETEVHGEKYLVRNEQLTWMALRDVPVGHFPGSPVMNRRDVNYTNKAVAKLRHGMPVIDFRENVRDAIDFRFMPFPEHLRRFGKGEWDFELVRPFGDTLDSHRQHRLFAVLNQLSAAMTRFAYCALDRHGRPVRRSWATRQTAEMQPYRPSSTTSWMPRPYLAFQIEQVQQLYWLATESNAREFLWECPNCRARIDGATFQHSGRSKIEVLENGDFMADCDRCGVRRKWFLDDGSPCRIRRRFPLAFQQQFCAAVAQGMQVTATGPEEYCGRTDSRSAQPQSSDRRLDLVAHRLRSGIDDTVRIVYLPRSAQIKVRVGTNLEAGVPWAAVLPPSLRSWADLHSIKQWNRLHEVCGGPAMVGYLQQLWFDHQMIRLPTFANQVLLPAELMGSAVNSIPPVGLWWDSAPILPHYAWEPQAAVFPPIRLREWNALNIALPGDVRINASIDDPRFAECNLPLRTRLRGRRRRLATSIPRDLGALSSQTFAA